MKKRNTVTRAAGVLLAAVLAAVSPAPGDAAPLTLTDSIREATAQNEQIRAAASGAEAARWNAEKAKGESGVSLSLTHSTSHIGGKYWNVYYLYDLPSSYSVNTVNASLPLYSGGRIENSVKAAQAGSEIGSLKLEDVKQNVVFETTRSYYSILACQNIQHVREEAVKQLEGHLKNVEAQYAVGTVTKADLLRSEVELANARQELVTAQNNTHKAVAAFNKTIGRPIGSATEIDDVLAYTKHPYKLEECVQYALQHHPEEQIAEKAVQQAGYGTKVAEAGQKVTVSLDGLYSTYDTRMDRFGTTQWLIGLTAHWNVLDGNVTKADVRVSEHNLEQARHQAQDVRRTVELGVYEAFLDMTRAETNIATTQSAVGKAQEDFALAQARYSVNLGTNLDVVDAQVALTAARTSYIQSLYDYNVSKAALEKAMGVPRKPLIS